MRRRFMLAGSIWVFGFLLVAITGGIAAAQKPTPNTPYEFTENTIPADLASPSSSANLFRAPASTTAGTPFTATIVAYKDTWVDQANPTAINGTSATLSVYSDGFARNTGAALIAFNLNSLPSDAVVLNATLSVYDGRRTPDAPTFSVKPYAVSPPTKFANNWAEKTTTWDNRPAMVDTGESALVTKRGWNNLDVTGTVADWVSGQRANNGFMLVPNDITVTGDAVFQARQETNPPTLKIQYIRRVTLAPIKDTYVDRQQPGTNFGTDSTLFAKSNGTRADRYTLVGFDLAGLPPNIEPISATLRLYDWVNRAADADQISTANDLFAEALLASWSEDTVTWNTTPSHQYLNDPPTSWAMYGWTNFDVNNIVTAWLAGDITENSILVRVADASNNSYYFLSKEQTGYPNPELIITYQKAVPPCNPISSASVSGAINGETGSLYNFNYAYTPPTADAPTAVQWTATDFPSPNSSSSASYEWTTPGTKTVTATLTHCGGQTVTTHTINIQEPPPTCSPITSASITGSTSGVTASQYNFAYTYNPTNADAPSEVQWTATDFPSPVNTNSTSYIWTTPGTKTITTTLTHCGGQTVTTHTIQIQDPPPTCTPITAASITGPTSGETNTQYSFATTYSPEDASPPDALKKWTATDFPNEMQADVAFYTWTTPGTKTITTTLTNCDGDTQTTHTIDIQEPPPTCDAPITGVTLTGPSLAAAGTSYRFIAEASPTTPTAPFTFTWETTDQAARVKVYNTGTLHQEFYTWTQPGIKSIATTVQNCGGAAVGYHSLEVLETANLPDLEISDAWYEPASQRVGYVIHNRGTSTAPAGHTISLSQANTEVKTLSYPTSLAPGAVRVGYLDYPWTCAETQQAVTIRVDAKIMIAELDETNNTWSQFWRCDQTPPVIVSGPAVSNITEHTAQVSFETDSSCSGNVQYIRNGFSSPATAYETGYNTSHSVSLTGLSSGTTYSFRAFCTDWAGNSTNSTPLFFETAALYSDPPEFEDPPVSLTRYFRDMYEFYNVTAKVLPEYIDHTDKVEFYMDGVLLGTDYHPVIGPGTYLLQISPHALGLTREEFYSPHQFVVKGYNNIGASAAYTRTITPAPVPKKINLEVAAPDDGYKFYTWGNTLPSGTASRLDIAISAAQFEYYCTWSMWSEGSVVPPGLSAVDCDGLDQEVDYLEILLDGIRKGGLILPSPGEFNFLREISVSGLALGDHDLVIKATASDLTEAIITRTLTVEQAEAEIDVTRSITHTDHYFEIALTVKNVGTGNAYIDEIVDNIIGFQQVNSSSLHTYDGYEVRTHSSYWVGSGARRRNHVALDLKRAGGGDTVELPPGKELTVSYIAIPILYEDPTTSVGIGNLDIDVFYKANLINEKASIKRTGTTIIDPIHGQLNLEQALHYARNAADYIIVTNPHRIHNQYDPYSSTTLDDRLFSDMANLAYLKNGVLGMLHTYDKEILNDLIQPGGWWYNAMNPWFRQKDHGYVLIVGETEIQPTYYAGTDQFATTISSDHVHYTDLIYANTTGSTARPELVVGRLIGDGLWQLIIQLENTINTYLGTPGHTFARDDALLLSGTGDGSSDNFIPTVNIIEDVLEPEFNVSKLHWKTYFSSLPILRINEIRVHQEEADDRDEYFEIAGFPDLGLNATQLLGVTYLVIGDSPAGGVGVIEAVVNLTGYQIPLDGTFLVAEAGGAFGAAPDLTTPLNFEDSDNVTHMLVRGFTGSDGMDLDTNDDGTLDLTPWTAVIDSVGLQVSAPGTGDPLYSATTVSRTWNDPVWHVYRCPNGWNVGVFTTEGRLDSPGAYNRICKVNTFKSLALNKDVILYRGHGNVDSINTIYTGDIQRTSFGDAHPLVFASACLTGNYEGDNDFNIAEAFMQSGAGVFIGATELSHRGTNDLTSKYFFRKWDPFESIGQILNATKRHAWNEDGIFDNGKMWAYEYNLYGCPKFGRVQPETEAGIPGLLSAPPAPARRTPLAAVPVQLQDYTVETIEGLDRVSIPDGSLRMYPGLPEVPTYITEVLLNPGETIQDVRLESFGNTVVATNLNIPNHQPQNDCEGCTPEPEWPDAGDGWYPALDDHFDWWAEKNPDGTTTVTIRITPFHYNDQTTDVIYNKDFTFAIDTFNTTVSATTLQVAQNTHAQGETVTATLVVENTGAAQDVVIRTSIRQRGGTKVLDALPLDTLHDLTGTGWVGLTYTNTIKAGEYQFFTELLDMQGHLLDTINSSFSVGIYAGETITLTATPTTFKPGELVNFEMPFENTGTVPITGTAVIRITNAATLTETLTITSPVSNLLPGASVTITGSWDTTGTAPGRYFAVGSTQFFGQTSDPKSVLLVNQPDYSLFLPLLNR